MNTKEWAERHRVPTGDVAPPIEPAESYPARTAREVAVRTIILHGLAAVGYGVVADSIVGWFTEQEIWGSVSPRERLFLLTDATVESQWNEARWRQEAEWALLWAIGKVEALGLPTRCCDTRRLVNEIIPALGDDLSDYVSTAKLRPPGVLLGEDLRSYDLWCYLLQAGRTGEPLPEDLNRMVLFERRYAFEWLRRSVTWDAVTCDA